MTSFVFDRVRQGDGSYLYVVGWFDAANIWHAVLDCTRATDAAAVVSYLNGGDYPFHFTIDWGQS
jgi:hypothetical protein